MVGSTEWVDFNLFMVFSGLLILSGVGSSEVV